MKKHLLPPIINHIITPDKNLPFLVVATHNQEKLKEFERILGKEVTGKDLKITEIQSEDPVKVLEEKAKDAWIANNGQPIVVEDSALLCKALDDLPGPFADQFTDTMEKRELLCRMLDEKDRSVVFQVGVALFDGNEVQKRIGIISGTIAQKPKGTDGFGFDDIFIPDNQEHGATKTYGEMSREEKDIISPRRLALEELVTEPFVVGKHIFQLPEPYELQVTAIQSEKLKNEQAVQHAHNLECLEEGKRKPYHQIEYAGGEIKRYVPYKNSTSLGIILTPMDTARDLYGKPIRLRTDDFGNPVFWQMGEKATKMALAARASEFLMYHNEDMYAFLRSMMKGEIQTTERPNKRSPVIEELLHVIKRFASVNNETLDLDDILGTAATSELGYARMYSDRKMSRTEIIQQGLLLNTTGIPSSIFALGGMPPVTGWRDVVVTAAVSFMRSYITRNSIFAGNVDLQIELFQQAKEQIYALKLPKDITELVIKQIGIAVGVENPEKIANDVYRMYKAGCSSIRFYTTNPDQRMIEVTEAVRQKVGADMTLCVGPIVNVEQALKLIEPNIKVNILLAGHGGGENCTSLAGGGAANSLELLYGMYLNPAFNNTAIGLEGGTGNAIGALLGMVDIISLNKRGVNGGIETGGLFVEHTNGKVCQPYHGSASPITQWIEAAIYPEIAKKRLNDAGKLRNVEGKANYMYKHRSTNSIVDNFQDARMYAGRALADQDSRSIYDLRENIKKNGHLSQRIVSNAAAYVASAHRESK